MDYKREHASIVFVTASGENFCYANENSQLRYPQTFEVARTVTLSGEAYFEVTPDSQKPFIISADAIEVKVLGTAFNVSAYAADTVIRIQVVHGKVQVKHLTDSLELEGGQRGLYNKITQKLSVEKNGKP